MAERKGLSRPALEVLQPGQGAQGADRADGMALLLAETGQLTKSLRRRGYVPHDDLSRGQVGQGCPPQAVRVSLLQ